MKTGLLLKTVPLFANLDERDLAAIEAIALRREFAKGQTIFNEGDPSRGFYVVVSGAVKLFRLGPDGRERVLHVVEAGATFAEATIFMEEYPATAAALVTTTTTVLIDKNGFKQILRRDERLTAKIFVAMAVWLHELRDALTDLTMKEVPARFASYVLSLPAAPGQPLKVALGKTVIAQMIGTSKETFSRLLARLAEQKVLSFTGRQIKILNRPRLQRIARGEEKI